jgi:parallel beta-helix repeat protein
VADDTKALNECLAKNRAVNLGGPENVYRITDTVYVSQKQPQVVLGGGATIRAGFTGVMMRVYSAAHTITGITFDGNAGAGGIGLVVQGDATHTVIDGCTFVDIAGRGIQVDGADHVTIAGNALRSCGHKPADGPSSTIQINNADHCSVIDNELLDCLWGVYFRAETAVAGISYYTCSGNTIIASNPSPDAAQGISNAYGRGGKIENNTVVGFTDNSIDCYGCNTMVISGNNTRGSKDGVFIGDETSYGITISGNVFNGPQRGVRVLCSKTNATVSGVVVTGNIVNSPTDGGILVQLSDKGVNIHGITVTNNDINVLGAGKFGIRVLDAETSRVSGNRIYRPREHGILVDGSDIIQVSDNLVQDAASLNTNKFDAIHVSASNRVVVRDNLAYGNARYAVNITAGTGHTITGTRWRSLATGDINDTANSTVKSDNIIF